MIAITKEQAIEVRKYLRNEKITICNRQGPSRKKSYYVAATYPVMKLLENMEKNKKIIHCE